MARNKLIYTAIDIGSTFSGWAYSTRAESQKINTKVYYPQFSPCATCKTPTCVLIRPDGETLECFGYDAQRKYEELSSENHHKDYYYFSNFKTKLYGKYHEPLNTGMTLIDATGKQLPAINVFAASIKFLADEFFADIGKRVQDIDRRDIQWILTIPAIWSDQAKYVMRESAKKAGLTSESVMFALEPEAASVYCQQLDVCAMTTDSGKTLSTLDVGSKYLVVDAGGGTVDLAIHEITPERGLKQIVASGGGICGGNTVNAEFEKFLIEVISEKKYNQFKQTYMEDWLYLMSEFETKKKYNPDLHEKIQIKISPTLKEVYTCKTSSRRFSFFRRSHRRSFEEAFSDTQYGKGVTVKRDKLAFSADVFQRFFHHAIEDTIRQMKKQLRKIKEWEVACILMVGGFSECILLQESVKSAFQGIPVIIPTDASIAVLKGSVQYGHNPPIISERVAKYTYGVRVVEQETSEGMIYNRTMREDIFSKHVSRGQLLKTDEPQETMTYHPTDKRQKIASIDICASKLPNPRYTTDKECHLIGSVKIDLPETEDARELTVLVFLAFGGTEITVTATVENTGSEVKAQITSLE